MKIPVVINLLELSLAIQFNIAGKLFFIVNTDGEVLHPASNLSLNHVYLKLPEHAPLGEFPDYPLARSYTRDFIAALNNPATWQGQTVMGQPVCGVFRFEVQ